MKNKGMVKGKMPKADMMSGKMPMKAMAPAKPGKGKPNPFAKKGKKK